MCETDVPTALRRLAAEFRATVVRDGAGAPTIVMGQDRFPRSDDIDALGFMAAGAWWRDDREELRVRVGWNGPASDVAEGMRADALRWLAGQGPAVERLPKAKRFAQVR